MDDDKESKSKNSLFGGLGSSLFNIFNKFSSESKREIDISHSKCNIGNKKYYVDLDKSDSDEADIPLSNRKKLENNKRRYTEALTKELQNDRSKRVIEGDISNNQNTKRVKLNNSFCSSSVLQDSSSGLFVKPKFSYRSIMSNIDFKTTNDLDENNLSHFGSLQSLAESNDESYQSATASRISHNIFSQKNIRISSPCPNNIIPKPLTPYSMSGRRYKTVVKRDKISSYLSREAITNESMFSPSTKTAPLTFNLSPNKEDTMYRFDLSQLRKTPVNNMNVDKQERWTCDQCDTINPINYNFCPSCSNANPLNKRNHKIDNVYNKTPIENSWQCNRCFTINIKDKMCCVCCFLAKDAKIASKPVDDNMDNNSQISVNNVKSSSGITFKFGDTNRETGAIKFGSINSSKENGSNELLQKFVIESEKVIQPPSSLSEKKWECSSCLVENDPKKDSCACCNAGNPKISSSKLFSFGQSSESKLNFGINKEVKSNEAFMFGTSNIQKFNSNTALKVQNSSGMKWECPSCMVDNEPNVTACVCCTSKNPKSIQLIPTNETSNGTMKHATNFSIHFGSSTVKNSENNEASVGPIKFGSIFNNLDNSTAIHSKEISRTKKWECPSCMLENDSHNNVCVCCQEKKPSKSSEDSVKQIFKFGSAATIKSKWECPSCMVENELETKICVCCGHKNMKSNEITSFGTSFKFGVTPLSSGTAPIQFGSTISAKVNPAKEGIKRGSKWECPSCMVENDLQTKMCVCCGENNVIPPSNKHTKEDIQFGSSKPKWECPSCMVENDDKIDTCVCCCTKNPKSSSTNANSVKLDVFSTKSVIGTKWVCPSCMVDNEPQTDACVCCSEKNPTKVNQKTSTFGSAVNHKSKWECPSCMVENDDKIDTCVCCRTKNPKSSSTNANNAKLDVFSTKSAIGTKWECPSCMVDNECLKEACVCCNTKNPNCAQQTTAIVFGSSKPSAIVFGSSKPSAIITANESAAKSATDNAKPTFTFGVTPKDGTEKSTVTEKMSNGFDCSKALNLADKKMCAESVKDECLHFSFCAPDKLPYESKVDLTADIEFEFSDASRV